MACIGGCYCAISAYGKDDASAASWIALACLVIFTFSFTVGLAPVPWVLVGELLPGMISKHIFIHSGPTFRIQFNKNYY